MKGPIATALVLGLALVAGSSRCLGESVYWRSSSTPQSPAYIVVDEVMKASVLYEKVKNHSNKNSADCEAKRIALSNRIITAVRLVAKENGYDIVVEKDSPKIEGAVDISDEVKAKIVELEGGSSEDLRRGKQPPSTLY